LIRLEYWRMKELQAYCRRFEDLSEEEKQMIGRAACEADPAMAGAILRSVTQGLTGRELGIRGGKSVFYDKRYLFFRILDRMKKNKR